MLMFDHRGILNVYNRIIPNNLQSTYQNDKLLQQTV